MFLLSLPDTGSMILGRNGFFLGLLLLVTVPVLSYKLVWLLRAKKATAVFAFHGKEIRGQMESRHAVMYFTTGNDTTFFNAIDNPAYVSGDRFPVLYQSANLADASLVDFENMWMTTGVMLGVPLVFLLIVFLHKEIIPYGSKIRLSVRAPFMQVIGKGTAGDT